ncbi:hypothetical protein V8F06_009837 [Rhypophila decipiens]
MASIAGYTVTHINTITTVFTPAPTCFTPSNLWLQTTGCSTYYPAFPIGKPTDTYVQSLECPYTVLGPRQNGNAQDTSCYQYNAFTAPGTVYSDCPQSMTAAAEDTTTFGNGIKLVQTTCCPAGAYEFAAPSGKPDISPTVIKGRTWSVVINTDSLCKASSVPQLSGKNLTITRSTSPTLATTTANWDGGALFATPQYIQKFLYEGPSTTSTCFGDSCIDSINPLVSTPTPTSAPTDSYVPPPSHPVTQFTPALSCLSKSNLWLVSSKCHLVEPSDVMTRSPPWLKCTIAKAGAPDDGYNTACYQGVHQHTDRTIGPDSTTTFYSACPVGYTAVHSSTHYPYDEGMLDEYGPTKIYSATHSAFVCCPTNYPFKYNDEDAFASSTAHDGKTFSLQFHRMPLCKATNVWALANRDVVMTLGAEDDAMLPNRGSLPRRGGGEQFVLNQQPPSPTEPPKLTTTRWDVVEKTLWAQAMQYEYVVFHESYTCYEGCDEWFTYSYHNLEGRVTPTGPRRTVRTRPPITRPRSEPTPEPEPEVEGGDEKGEEPEEDSEPAYPPSDPRFQGQGQKVESSESGDSVNHAHSHGAETDAGEGQQNEKGSENDDAKAKPNTEVKPEGQKKEPATKPEGAAELYPGVQAEKPAGVKEEHVNFYPGVQGHSEGKKEEVMAARPKGDKKARRRR